MWCIMEGHDELIIRKSDSEEGGLEDDNQAVIGRNHLRRHRHRRRSDHFDFG